MFGISTAIEAPSMLAANTDVPLPEGKTNRTSAVQGGVERQDLQLRGMMRSAQLGDTRVYAKLLRAIIPWLRRTISKKRKFLQEADIDDLVQDTLLSVHSVRDTYDPGRPFIPWLMAITQHRLADAARRYYRRSAQQNELEGWSLVLVAEESETQSHGTPRLMRAIDGLPPRQRTAIQLLKLREMSLKEAADASGSTVQALKVSAHRAMASLRSSLMQ